jgi:uncharacterized protein (UPF0548 family)
MMFVGPRFDPGRYTGAEVTYPEHGATSGALPPGYRHVQRRERIGTGEAAFRRAVAALTTWTMHRGAGLTVLSAPPTAEPGSVVVMRLGPPVVGIVVPCRVMYAVDEPDRGGFAYGTLPGHPERGEEAFMVTRTGDDEVHLTIRAFSRPANLLVRLAGPLNHAVQDFVAGRYIRVLRDRAR